MPSIARLQASDCANPILDLRTSVAGVPTDMEVVEFQIFDVSGMSPAQVYPAIPGDRAAVNLLALCPTGDVIGTGHYVAKYTPDAGEALGAHEIRWFFKLESAGPENTYVEAFDVSDVVGSSGPAGLYTTIEIMREEGITIAIASDARLLRTIERVSRMIDLYTGQKFYPHAATYRIDGRGSRAVMLDEPIISISSLKVLDAYDVSLQFIGQLTDVALEDLRIYNRHLTENLQHPDDRKNPRIEFAFHSRYTWNGAFPTGRQNIEIAGMFGFTEYDGTPTGRVPLMIQHAANLMVVREIAPLTDTDTRDDAGINRRRMNMQKTRDQAVGYGKNTDVAGSMSAGGLGKFTGDAEIDSILEHFVRPIALGAV